MGSDHLDQCTACQTRLEELAGGTGWMPDWDGESPSRLDVPNLERYRAMTLSESGDTFVGSIATGPGEALGDNSLSAFLAPSDRPEFRARFGPFYVISIIGRGGMGIVFKAHDPSLKRNVAVKVLAPQLATSETARKRFLREARAAAQVVDDHVVTIHNVDEIQGFPYLVMHVIEGESLESKLRRTGPLAIPEVIRVAVETAKGLRAAHAAGIVHRDIKPANILLEASSGRCKITDFGLARAVQDETLTRSGYITGTPHYMAPEQARGDEVDRRTDLYSLGAVLFSACTGLPPFDGKTPLSVLNKVVETPSPDARETNPSVPDWLEQVIRRLMAKDPGERFQSAEELLERLARGETEPERTSNQTPVRHRVLAAWLAVACCLLVTASIAGQWYASSMIQRHDREANGTPGTRKMDAIDPDGTSPCRIVHGDGTIDAAEGLREALKLARDGSTIELTNSKPIVVEQALDTGGKKLLIRAAAGATPVITMTRHHRSIESALLTVSGPLVLEGLEFRYVDNPQGPPTRDTLIRAEEHPLFVSNCHFNAPDLPGSRLSCLSIDGTTAVIQNSLFTCGATGTSMFAPVQRDTQIDVENCAFLANNALTLAFAPGGRSGTSETVRIHSSTVIGQCAVHLLGRDVRPGQGETEVGIRAQQCLFDVDFLCTVATGSVSDPIRAETIALDRLNQGIRWSGAGNVFSVSRSYCGFSLGPRAYATARSGPQSLISWQDFCLEEADSSREAKVFFPDAPAGARPQPGDSINGAGFRFVLDRQGDMPEGTTGVGVSVETLGPGTAFETWRHSSAANQWESRWREVLGK